MTKRAEIKWGDRTIPLPKSTRARIAAGVVLIIGGTLGFLPILGFWMIPLGILVLSYDISVVRKLRRRVQIKLQRRKDAAEAKRNSTTNGNAQKDTEGNTRNQDSHH